MKEPLSTNGPVRHQYMALFEADRHEAMNRSKAFILLMSYYRCAMMEIETKFKVLNEEYSLVNDRNPIGTIKTRLKKPQSIMEKLDRQHFPKTLQSIEENLHDIAGVRVICAFPEDVYTLADAFLKQDDITLIQKKDYIANPKPNGYRSLHLIVSIPIFLSNGKREMRVEVQLRTIAMDFWASLEHQLRYKKDAHFTPEMEAELLKCAKMSADLDMRMDRLRRSALLYRPQGFAYDEDAPLAPPENGSTR